MDDTLNERMTDTLDPTLAHADPAAAAASALLTG